MLSAGLCNTSIDEHKVYCVLQVPIFNHLSEEEMHKIVQLASSKRYEKGEMVFFTEGKTQVLHIVHKGMLKQVRVSASGREQIVRTLSPGDFVGELALFDTNENEGYIEALEPSEVCQIRGQDVKRLLREFPQIAIRIIRQLSSRLASAEATIEQLGIHTMRQRVATYLLKRAPSVVDSGKTSQITLPFSKGDLASMLGASQETLSRTLAEFQDEGWIGLHGQRGIEVRNRKSLQALLIRD